MLLQRFFKIEGSRISRCRIAQACLCLMLLGGCAAGPGSRSQPDASIADGEPGMAREIPPRAMTLFEQAVAIMSTGDIVEAQFRFQEFLLQYPDYPGAHVNLAIIHARNGNDRAAQGSITDALIIDPEHPAALNQLGMLLRRQGKFLDAESAYMKAVTANPEYALAHYNLGVLNELYLRRFDVALLHFEYYQLLTIEDKQVEKWITDLKRRVQVNQRTANVTE